MLIIGVALVYKAIGLIGVLKAHKITIITIIILESLGIIITLVLTKIGKIFVGEQGEIEENEFYIVHREIILIFIMFEIMFKIWTIFLLKFFFY